MLNVVRYAHECQRCGYEIKCGNVGFGYAVALGDYYAHPYKASGYIIGKTEATERYNPRRSHMEIRPMPKLDEKEQLGRYLWQRARAWLRRRAIVFYWLEEATKARYARGDRAAFAADFCLECEGADESDALAAKLTALKVATPEGRAETVGWCPLSAPEVYDADFPPLGR